MNSSVRVRRALPRLVLVTALVAALVLGQGVVPAAGSWKSYMGPTLISKGYQGERTSDSSTDPWMSSDGRYIVFRSRADNLTGPSTGVELRAVYRYDRLTNTMEQVSAPDSGPMDATRGARDPRISSDGRYVLFYTGLALVPEDENDGQDFYVKDMDTGVFRWIDFRGDGSSLPGNDIWEPHLAGDGSYFIFECYGYDLLGDGKTTVNRNVWGYDLESDEATLVSAPADPAAIANYGSRDAAITDDGRYVVFFTGNDWDPADTNNTGGNNGQDFYVKDTQTGEVRWIDFYGDGTDLGTTSVDSVAISGDGSRFVFDTDASLLPGDTGRHDIYGYNLIDDEAEFVSGPTVEDRGSRDPSITDDGRYVMFYTGQAFADDDANGGIDTGQDIYIKDMETDEFTRVPVLGPEAMPGNDVYDIHISGDGEHIVFTSDIDFSLQDTNDFEDVYYYPVGGKRLVTGAERFEGADRYATAVKVSQEAFPQGAATVVIATGENWPDALGGSALAGAVEGPILLTRSGSLPAAVKAELQRLGAANVYLLGGYGAISPEVETELNALVSGWVWRIGGADRYATSDAIAKRAIAVQGASFDRRVTITTGLDFPDAVGAAPLGAGLGWPVILVKPTATSVTLPAVVQGAAILGGNAAVGPALETYLVGKFGDAAVDRLGGATRYETSAKVAQYGVDNGMVWDGVGVATGTNFPDSLAGGVALGLHRSVLLLTPGTALHPNASAKLTANKDDISSVVFLGGTAAVSSVVETQVKAILGL